MRWRRAGSDNSASLRRDDDPEWVAADTGLRAEPEVAGHRGRRPVSRPVRRCLRRWLWQREGVASSRARVRLNSVYEGSTEASAHRWLGGVGGSGTVRPLHELLQSPYLTRVVASPGAIDGCEREVRKERVCDEMVHGLARRWLRWHCTITAYSVNHLVRLLSMWSLRCELGSGDSAKSCSAYEGSGSQRRTHAAMLAAMSAMMVCVDERIYEMVMSHPIPERLLSALGKAPTLPPYVTPGRWLKAQRLGCGHLDPDCLPPPLRETLALACCGYTNDEIAEATHYSPNTVRDHMRVLLACFRARNRTHLAALAVARGYISREQLDSSFQ